jgi:hypothetical protein
VFTAVLGTVFQQRSFCSRAYVREGWRLLVSSWLTSHRRHSKAALWHLYSPGLWTLVLSPKGFVTIPYQLTAPEAFRQLYSRTKQNHFKIGVLWPISSFRPYEFGGLQAENSYGRNPSMISSLMTGRLCLLWKYLALFKFKLLTFSTLLKSSSLRTVSLMSAQALQSRSCLS